MRGSAGNARSGDNTSRLGRERYDCNSVCEGEDERQGDGEHGE